MVRLLFLLQLACTLAMTGIIWFVQVVHYPNFLQVSTSDFVRFEASHATRTGWVVAPLMCLELALAFSMLWPHLRCEKISLLSAWSGLLLVAAIWLSTFLIQVPLHNRLAQGFDAATIRQLVAGNWIRTVCWSLRTILLLRLCYLLLAVRPA